MPLIIVDSDAENPIIKDVPDINEQPATRDVWVEDPNDPNELICVKVSNSKSKGNLEDEDLPQPDKKDGESIPKKKNTSPPKSKRKSHFDQLLEEDSLELVQTIPSNQEETSVANPKGICGDPLLGMTKTTKQVSENGKKEEDDQPSLNIFDESVDDLNSDQQNVYFQIINTNKCGFITGGPGTGKTYLLTKLIKYWTNHRKLFCLSSTTGVSAHVLNQTINKVFGDKNGDTPEFVPLATTFHHLFGIPPDMLDKFPIPSEIMGKVKRICGNKLKAAQQLLLDDEIRIATLSSASIIVIDEISMFPPMLLEQLDQVLKSIHSSSEPFGGVQIIFTGDFYQLPPIQTNSTFGQYVFQSQAWFDAKPLWLELQINERQNDNGLKYLIDCVRRGEIDQQAKTILEDRVGAYIPGLVVEYPDDPSAPLPQITPVITLYPSRNEVEQYNKRKFDELPGDSIAYIASKIHIEGVINDQLVNQYTKVLEDRVKQSTEEKLILKKGCLVMLTVNTNVAEGLVNGATGVVTGFADNYPIVKFSSISNPIVIGRHVWKQYIRDKLKVPSKFKKAKITDRYLWMSHVPLRLAWSLTVHKAQGSTLPAVSVAINSKFATPGLALVALSRVSSVENLQILDWDRATLESINPLVKEFYESRGQSIYTKDNPTLKLLSSAYPPSFAKKGSIDSGARMAQRGKFGGFLTPKIAFQKHSFSTPLKPTASSTSNIPAKATQKKFPLF